MFFALLQVVETQFGEFVASQNDFPTSQDRFTNTAPFLYDLAFVSFLWHPTPQVHPATSATRAGSDRVRVGRYPAATQRGIILQ
jgi:hypothetical protein